MKLNKDINKYLFLIFLYKFNNFSNFLYYFFFHNNIFQVFYLMIILNK